MKNTTYILFTLFLTSLPSQSFAKRWQANFDSYYYEFEGDRPARDNIYSFEGLSFSSQSLSLGYKLKPDTSVTLVGKYNRNYVETVFAGFLFEDDTEGFADSLVKVSKIYFKPSGLYTLELGIFLPTGSISEKNASVPNQNYFYNLQLGSGTYDFFSSLSYFKMKKRHLYGAYTSATVRTGKNKFDYRRGDEFIMKIWYNYSLHKYLFGGVWFNYYRVQGVSGQDRTFGRNIFNELYHKPRDFWDLTFNLNSEINLNKSLKLKSLLGVPIWQDSQNIDRVHVDTNWLIKVGLEAQF